MVAGEFLVPGIGEAYLGRRLAVALTVAAIAGTCRLARETGVLPYAAFGAGLSVLLILWVYPPTTRLLWPLLPLAVAGVLRQARHIAGLARSSLSRGRSDRAVGMITMLALIFIALPWAVRSWGSVSGSIPELLETDRHLYMETQPAREWIRANVPNDAVVLAYFDAMLYLETGRRATRVSLDLNAKVQTLIDEAADPAPFMRSAGIRYLLVTPSDFHADFSGDSINAPAEIRKRQRASPAFETLWSRGDYAVLRLR